MKLKRFFKRGLQKAIANDFKNLVEDKSMAMPSGFLCYRYWDDEAELTKRYYFVVNFAGSTSNRFTFECAWQPDVETDIVNSNGWPKSLSDDDGCLRIIYLDSRFSPPPIQVGHAFLQRFSRFPCRAAHAVLSHDYRAKVEKMTMDDSTNRWDDANGSAWNKKEWICQRDK